MTDALARISARRPWITIGLWVVAVVVALGLSGQLLASATTTELRLSPGFESEDTRALLEERFPITQQPREVIVVTSDTLTVDDPAFAEQVTEVFGAVTALGEDVVVEGFHYFALPDPRLVSEDRKTTIVPLLLAGTLEEAGLNVEQIFHAIDEASTDDRFRVLIVGSASSAFENNEFALQDLEQGERFGIPVALIILLVLFGAVVAALIPIGLAIVAIAIALGAAALIGQVYELVFFVTLMITMIGLAVGIDYSLIMISRFRDEMRRGLPVADAVERMGATAGRTVLFSGVTVVIALLGLFIVPMGFFRSLGLGAVLVVIAELAATLTLLPAVLMLLGPEREPPLDPVHRQGPHPGHGIRGPRGWRILGRHHGARDAIPRHRPARRRDPDDHRDRVLLRHPDRTQRRRQAPRGRAHARCLRGARSQPLALRWRRQPR